MKQWATTDRWVVRLWPTGRMFQSFTRFEHFKLKTVWRREQWTKYYEKENVYDVVNVKHILLKFVTKREKKEKEKRLAVHVCIRIRTRVITNLVMLMNCYYSIYPFRHIHIHTSTTISYNIFWLIFHTHSVSYMKMGKN